MQVLAVLPIPSHLYLNAGLDVHVRNLASAHTARPVRLAAATVLERWFPSSARAVEAAAPIPAPVAPPPALDAEDLMEIDNDEGVAEKLAAVQEVGSGFDSLPQCEKAGDLAHFLCLPFLRV
jgi:hypothetical protein